MLRVCRASLTKRIYASCVVSLRLTHKYQETFDRSIRDPEGFWEEQSQAVEWTKEWKRGLDPVRSEIEPSQNHWFPGGELNMCDNLLDRHIREGRGANTALIFHSAYTGERETLSFNDLRNRVAHVSGVLQRHGSLGYQKQTETQIALIYMPNSIEAIVAMLACARIGLTHAVVFGGFAAQELATRIRHAKPSIILTASCGIEPKRVIPYKPLLDEALALAGAESTPCIIKQRPQCRADMVPGRDWDWDEEAAKATPVQTPVTVPSNHPLYVLYTSGTTGNPKGIIRDTGGYAVALKWSMEHIYNSRQGDVFWAASDVGWVVGHSYMAYGPLLAGCSSLIFEGKPVGTPHAGVFWDVIREHNVNTFFCAPTAFRAIRGEDPTGKELIKNGELSSLRAVFLAGERSDAETLSWARHLLGKPVVDNYWQTETGWPMVSNMLHPSFVHIPKDGSATKPVPGFDVKVLASDGQEAPPLSLGSICVAKPLPPGCMNGLFRNLGGMEKTYFQPNAGFYHTGDSGYLDSDGYLFIMTRTGDLINVAGHRLSTGSLEEALGSHPDVAECAVVGQRDPIKGQVPLGLVVLSSSSTLPEQQISAQCKALVRQRIGAVAAFKAVLVVPRLPKTRSGKILRGVVQQMVDKDEWKVPATAEDPSVFDELSAILERSGV